MYLFFLPFSQIIPPLLLPQIPKDCSIHLCLFCCLTYRIGNTCTPVVDSCWCMAKLYNTIQYCKYLFVFTIVFTICIYNLYLQIQIQFVFTIVFTIQYCKIKKREKFHLFFYWRIIALQNFVVYYQTSKWISYRYTYIPYLLNFPPRSIPIPPL